MSGSDKVQTVRKHRDQTEVRHSLTSLLAQAIRMHIHMWRIATQITHSSICCHILTRVKWTSNSISPLSPSHFTLSQYSLHLCSFHLLFLPANFALYTLSVSQCRALLSAAVHPLFLLLVSVKICINNQKKTSEQALYLHINSISAEGWKALSIHII